MLPHPHWIEVSYHPAMLPPAVPRYHAFDALRAAMMLLGLVLHSAASYTRIPLGWGWPYQDPRTSVVFDLLLFLIHLFRIPAFFMVAGCFAALLYYRDGPRRFARNRAMRVLLPLVVFWGAVIPLFVLGFAFAIQRIGELPIDHVRTQSILREPVLGHLWFLYDLLIFYAAALLIAPLAIRLPHRFRQRFGRLIQAVVTSTWGPLALGIVTTLTLLPMKVPGLETSAALLPEPRVLVAYGVFFAFGWALFGQREAIGALGDRWKRWSAAGVGAAAAYLIVAVEAPLADPWQAHVLTVTIAGAATWLLVFGIAGLFVRHMAAPRPAVRYFSDASYWMYIVHVVPIVWIAGLLAHAPVPSFLKFGTVLISTVLVTTVTYHYLVRSTIVGELLNGRRYPKVFPSGPLVAITGAGEKESTQGALPLAHGTRERETRAP